MIWIAAAKSMTPYVTWIGVMIAGLVAATIVLLVIRARVLGKDAGSAPTGMLDELRTMRDRGEITPEEFDAAKGAMVARLSPGKNTGKNRAAPSPKPSAGMKPSAGELHAKPGFDLTGQRLPTPPDESPDR